MKSVAVCLALSALLSLPAGAAQAQRAGENAARAAGDAFGTNIGAEQVGLYSGSDVRGFSPTVAGNVRLNGMYIDAPAGITPRLVTGSQIRVGLTAQNYAFPAPTGINDFSLRPVGDKPVESLLLSAGPHGAYAIEYDAQGLITPGRFGVFYGFFANRTEHQPGDILSTFGIAVAPRWRPTERIEIRPFYALHIRYNDKAGPLVFAAGPVLPAVPESRNFSPKWTENDTIFQVNGIQANATLDPNWQLRTSVFRFTQDDEGPISDAYLNTGADGVAQVRRFANQRPFDHETISGEARLTGVIPQDAFRHTVHLALRGRAVDRNYGGGSVVNFGPSMIGRDNAPAEPAWTFGSEVDDSIRQSSVNASYALARRNLGEVSLGVQKMRYRKTLKPEFGVKSVAEESPLFWNGAASLNVSQGLAAYAAFTQGLEEAPNAPEVAVNAQEAPPAIHTRQSEFGVRYIVRPGLRLVLGYFDIEKPYFALDGLRVWRELGVERHRGVETSLTGELLPGLNVVLGYVHQSPTVSGEAVDAGLIGRDPVGQMRRTGRANLDYRLPGRPAVSLEAGMQYSGGRAVSSRLYPELGGRQLHVEDNALFDLGVRYRFAIRDNPATLRVQALNIGDTRAWVGQVSGGLSVTPPRRLAVTLTTDF